MKKKQLNKRHKKMIQSIAVNRNETGLNQDFTTIEGREAAIVRQLNRIHRDYLKLMNDVLKELDLVRGWIGSRAQSKKLELKKKISARLSNESV